MNYARRRSGAYRPLAAQSPKATALRRPPVRATPLSRVAAPLPSSATTGRHSTLGHTGCPTLLKAPVASTSRVTAPSSLRPTRQSTPTILAQRSTSHGPTRNVAAPPVAGRVRGAPTATRPPSELSQLKDKLLLLEQELISKTDQLKSKDDQIKMKSELTEMLKDSLESTKIKLETVSMERDTLKDLVTTLKDQLEQQKATIEKEEARSNDLIEQLDEKEAAMRKLHNDVVDLRGQIRVAVRVRPMLKTEEEVSSASIIEYPSTNAISFNQGAKPSGTFTFEKVFTPVFSQQSVFANIEDFILSALHGYNVGLIAFGQTGSGKTHTMRGGEAEDEGIIPRTASYLFNESKKLEATGWKFEFSLSFMEIYNNEAFDLLNNHSIVKLRLINHTVSLDGLTEHPLTKQSDMAGLLNVADRNRKTAATKCNEYSSRSHAIYMWKIKAQQRSTGISTSSVLKLVDLAGSERAKESGVVGQQFKEMTNINQSLSVLQKCINMQKAKSTHVPYRDTKLTQVLMDCLGRGNSKTMVVVNINPCNEQAVESKRSIEFAAKMRETHIGSAVQQRDL
ncbi:hypothetical protein CAEBREN_02388 [Caenorhabditis brenneri]|uniref:Kinesin-like protein n=1 Tax=Caenorhabditis brenneri TaxID=135651 RepID=G0NML7_CAEBE|nr:hypothetical protein CAEBREN_02388 [Caenorhabditis brenneri]